MKRLAIVLVVGIGGGVGCGAAPKRGEDLIESVRTYNDGVRWDRLVVAASRVPPAEREDFIDDRDELAENLEITDWEVVRVREESKSKARVHVKYTWYRNDEGIVRETQAEQRWERSGHAWLIVDERRSRGEEMPGLSEKSQDDDEGVSDAEPR